MKRIIIEQFEQGQQLTQQALNEADKHVGRFCKFELRNLERLHDALYSPFMDKLMVTITCTGNLGMIWILMALVLLASDSRRQYGYQMLIALLLCITIGNLIIKNIARRNRPFFHKNYKLLIKQPWDYSFPSGHTLSSFAAATVLTYLNENVGVIAIVYACLIALSRLYLRVHFFTDVFFSMVLGTGLGILAIRIFETRAFGLL
ncbi:MAG: phosphatase PAP2 family protein [Clostridiales bacterium]|nr:phosphatase PAP2 family protein [Clostridiales bacterium]